jgi:hypothetical protein
MYLDEIGKVIRQHVPENRLPAEDSTLLFRLYALLLQAKGTTTTDADVHDAWSAWMAERDAGHESLLEFEKLDASVRDEDKAFTKAIHAAAVETQRGRQRSPFEEVLYPNGQLKALDQSGQLLDLYKMMVASSEALVNRRQAVNTFFLTINGALLTAYGLVAQNIGTYRVSGAALIVIAFAGLVLCSAWRSLIISFGQLNRGKFKVINTVEKLLPVSIYAAEWEALGRGEDAKVYRSFTSREIYVPYVLAAIHGVALVVAVVVLYGRLSSGEVSLKTDDAVSRTAADVREGPSSAPATAP